MRVSGVSNHVREGVGSTLFLIFLSYAFGKPMDLEFSMPEVVAVVASVYILFQISGDGETNWIEGIQLLSVYLILGILFFFLSEAHHSP